MTVTSLSFTLVTTCAPQGAQPAAAVPRKAPPLQDDDGGCGHTRPASRQNRLADAMMSALRELGFGGTAAPTTTTTTTPATSEAASVANAPASVESAVQQFAHALFQALRQSGHGKKDSDDDSGRVAGHGHRRHHQHPGQGHGYGNLSQRLEALSQTAGTTAPGATTAAAPASAAGTPAAATPTPVATPVAPPAKNPLLDAFTKLFDTLKPAATGTTASAPATDMADKLRQFLHTLAQALAPDTMGSVQRAQVGGLVDVSA